MVKWSLTLSAQLFSLTIPGVFPWKYVGIPFEEQDTPEVVKEVLDVLDMWSMIERSYENLSKEEQEWLVKEAATSGKKAQNPMAFDREYIEK